MGEMSVEVNESVWRIVDGKSAENIAGLSDLLPEAQSVSMSY